MCYSLSFQNHLGFCFMKTKCTLLQCFVNREPRITFFLVKYGHVKGISNTTASWSFSVSFLSFLSVSKSDRRKYSMESLWKFGFAELSDIGAQKMASPMFFCKSFNSTPIFSCCASPHVPTFFSNGQVSEKSMNKFPSCSPPREFKTWPSSKINLPFHWSKFSQKNRNNNWKHPQPLCYAPSYPSLSPLLLSSSQGSLQCSLDTPEDVQGETVSWVAMLSRKVQPEAQLVKGEMAAQLTANQSHRAGGLLPDGGQTRDHKRSWLLACCNAHFVSHQASKPHLTVELRNYFPHHN